MVCMYMYKVVYGVYFMYILLSSSFLLRLCFRIVIACLAFKEDRMEPKDQKDNTSKSADSLF